MSEKNERVFGVLGAVAIIVMILGLFGLVGYWDIQAAEEGARHYCDMVGAGHWPDFRGIYSTSCNPTQSAR